MPQPRTGLWVATLIAAATLVMLLIDTPPRAAGHRCIFDELQRSQLAAGASAMSGTGHGSAAQWQGVKPPSRAVDTWRPIRITVFTEDLNNDSRYCTKPGESRFDFSNSTRECNSTGIFTDRKKYLLREVVIPDAVQMHRDRLLVQPVRDNIVVNRFTWGTCSHFTIPESHHTTGVPNTDFVLYVAAGPIELETEAWAVPCQLDRSGQPIVGVVNVSPRTLLQITYSTRVVMHEVLHALGFGGYYFYRLGMLTTTSIRGKRDVPVIISPKVVEAARAHYGCSTMKYMELEDMGGLGTAYSHWKMRNAKDELMAPSGSGGFYTAMTIAAMEDTGYYKGNYSNAESMAWGKNAGCVLFDEKCVIDGVSQVPEMFCAPKPSQIKKYKCTSDRLAIGICNIKANMSYPSIFQYFTNVTIGGTVDSMDFCPYIMPFWSGECTNGNPKAFPGSTFSESARCFSALPSATLEMSDGNNISAVCVDVLCEEAAATYRVRVKGASDFVDCPVGGILLPSKYSEEFSSGAIECPPYEEVCTGNTGNRSRAHSGVPGPNKILYMAAFGMTGGAQHLILMVVLALVCMVFFA